MYGFSQVETVPLLVRKNTRRREGQPGAAQVTTSPPDHFPGTCYPLLQWDSTLARPPFRPRFCRNASSPSSPAETLKKKSILKAPRFAGLQASDASTRVRTIELGYRLKG